MYGLRQINVLINLQANILLSVLADLPNFRRHPDCACLLLVYKQAQHKYLHVEDNKILIYYIYMRRKSLFLSGLVHER